MKTTQLLRKLHTIPKSYFSLIDLQKFYSGDKENLKVTVSRLTRQDKLTRLLKGYYTLDVSRFDLEQFACELLQPSYISLEYALWHYGIIEQIPARITLVTEKKGRTYETVQGNVIEYTHITKQRYFGYKIEGNTIIAEKEKALLDELYLISLKKRHLSLQDLDISTIDVQRLEKWLKKFPPFTQKLWKEVQRISS